MDEEEYTELGNLESQSCYSECKKEKCWGMRDTYIQAPTNRTYTSWMMESRDTYFLIKLSKGHRQQNPVLPLPSQEGSHCIQTTAFQWVKQDLIQAGCPGSFPWSQCTSFRLGYHSQKEPGHQFKCQWSSCCSSSLSDEGLDLFLALHLRRL